MFRKLTLITALAATLAFPAVALAAHGGHGGGGHGGGGHGGGGHGGGGWHGGGGGWHGGGGGRRFWGGRWWPYGVGPCWRWYYGTWAWVC